MCEGETPVVPLPRCSKSTGQEKFKENNDLSNDLGLENLEF